MLPLLAGSAALPPRHALATAGAATRALLRRAYAAPPCAWLDLPGGEGRAAVCSVLAADESESHDAAQAAWAGLRRALGGAPPTFLLLTTSFGPDVLPPLAAVAVQLTEARGAEGHAPPLIGCTAPLWLPGVGALSPLSPRPPGRPARRLRHHVTLSAAALPGCAAHLVPWQSHDSLPRLPYSGARELAAARPQVLLIGHPGAAEHMECVVRLLQRFESLFPGSPLAGVIAGATSSGGSIDGGGGSGGGASPWLGFLPGAREQQQQQQQQGEEEAGQQRPAGGAPGRRHVVRRPPTERAAASRQAGGGHGSGGEADAGRDGSGGGGEGDGGRGSAPDAASSGAFLFSADASGLAGGGFRSAVHDSGLVGLLLDPLHPAHGDGADSSGGGSGGGGGAAAPLSPASAAALLRLLLGAQRLGSRSLGMTVMRDELRAELSPTQPLAAAFRPPSPLQEDPWVPVVATPRGLRGEGPLAPQRADELPLFVLATPVPGAPPGLWPGEEQHINVFEGRYKLLIRAALEQAVRGGLPPDGGGAARQQSASKRLRRGDADAAAAASSGAQQQHHHHQHHQQQQQPQPHGPAVSFGLASSEGFGVEVTLSGVVVGASAAATNFVRVAAGRRFRCVPGTERTLPGTFGLAAAKVDWIEDERASRKQGKELVRCVGALMQLLRAALARERQERRDEVAASARFASALGAPMFGARAAPPGQQRQPAPSQPPPQQQPQPPQRADPDAPPQQALLVRRAGGGRGGPSRRDVDAKRFARALQDELTPALAAQLSLFACAAIPAPGELKWRWFADVRCPLERATEQWQHLTCSAGCDAAAAPGAARLAAERQAAAARAVEKQLPEWNALRALLTRDLRG
ncbi:hypothetical protein Rsub_00511 [Raphidocelis subcapitata]|uniref:Uncharacterized protein n=1 Tax=Raphidocelis subcapitata TaxID=307507 RepID=A0A2V0NQI0_9CHLO|nr:hypothetical protein Rsub_00511 [Raphidocelis subcapitata]|eukprot:GBF87800.1 hypothetical protein Rsub_00511 [Raphidocelis subcapitata]